MEAFKEQFLLTALSIDPTIIKELDEAGVDRIGIDIERLGKRERQTNSPNSRISSHGLHHLVLLRENVKKAALFARLNPINFNTEQEIEIAIELGAEVLMLPYFKTIKEVNAFVKLVNERAHIILLVETKEGVEALPVILRNAKVKEIMVGLNDLHLSLNFKNPFEIITSGYLEKIANEAHKASIKFGFGGLARVSDNSLPIPSDLIYAQYARIRAETAWISRSFFNKANIDIQSEVKCLRERIAFWNQQQKQYLDEKYQNLCEYVNLLTKVN